MPNGHPGTHDPRPRISKMDAQSVSERWFDAVTCNIAEAPKMHREPPVYFPELGDGASEALLTTLIYTWMEPVSSLFLDRGYCRWFLFSAIGPGDCRGIIEDGSGRRPKAPVVVEIKHIVRGRKALEGAAAQALVGLDRSYQYSEEVRLWHGRELDPTRARLVVAAASLGMDHLTQVARSVAEWVDGKKVHYPNHKTTDLAGLGSLRELTLQFCQIERYVIDGARFVKACSASTVT